MNEYRYLSAEEAQQTLRALLGGESEWECVEFKEAKHTFTFDELGQYFSALSNEANLRAESSAWLVMGVNNKHEVIGTDYKPHAPSLHQLKHSISQHTAMNMTFTQVYVVRHLEAGWRKPRRVLMLQIPPCPRGIPMSWKGHFYGRDGESLVPLKLDELETIRSQGKIDWSATLCRGATHDDLDSEAVAVARLRFKEKNPRAAADCDGWSDGQFLDKAKLTRSGKITHTTLLLVGRNDSAHLLSPAHPEILWILKGPNDENIDNESFGPPFVVSVDQFFARIRNTRFQFPRADTLFPLDLLQYDTWIIRELLHNCIAHQDYTANRRVTVVDRDGSLTFTNAGSFIPRSVEAVVERNSPQDHFRNRFLTDAMTSINMIETLGNGIPRIFMQQRRRGFPMPDYDLTDPQTVSVQVLGKVLDENYTRTLLANTDLPIMDVIALDKVQKGVRIDPTAFARLRARNLVEGTRTKARVAAHVPGASLDESQIPEAIVHLLREGQTKSATIAANIIPRLPASMGEVQKTHKIRNAFQQLAREGVVKNVGKAGRGAVWKLLK